MDLKNLTHDQHVLYIELHEGYVQCYSTDERYWRYRHAPYNDEPATCSFDIECRKEAMVLWQKGLVELIRRSDGVSFLRLRDQGPKK